MAHSNPRTERIETIRLWLKAFIPGTIESALLVPGTGEHAGKTMLPTPGPLNRCFLTDQRGFSADFDASARMHSVIEIDVTHGSIIHQSHQCYDTIEVDCETGEELCRQSASIDQMRFANFDVADGGNRIVFRLEGSSKNPCLEIATLKVSPNLDYSGEITIDLDAARQSMDVHFDGKVEIYPAFEMYVAVNDQQPVAVFEAPALPQSSPMDLVGPPGRDISRSVRFRL